MLEERKLLGHIPQSVANGFLIMLNTKGNQFATFQIPRGNQTDALQLTEKHELNYF